MKVFSIGIVLIISALSISPMIPQEEQDDFLIQELNEIERYITYRDSLNKDVSKVPVAWHLDHMLLTINEIYKVMDTSNVENYKSRFNMGRTMMFTFNKIPRGKAESPEQVRPPKIICTDSINIHLKQARIYLKLFDSLPPKAHFKHPYIGILKRKHAKKFLKIHTNHHLEIMRDILEK